MGARFLGRGCSRYCWCLCLGMVGLLRCRLNCCRIGVVVVVHVQVDGGVVVACHCDVILLVLVVPWFGVGWAFG